MPRLRQSAVLLICALCFALQGVAQDVVTGFAPGLVHDRMEAVVRAITKSSTNLRVDAIAADGAVGDPTATSEEMLRTTAIIGVDDGSWRPVLYDYEDVRKGAPPAKIPIFLESLRLNLAKGDHPANIS